MLSWLFKKRGSVAAPSSAPSPSPAAEPSATPADEQRAGAKAKQAEEATAAWWPRLESARGDDAALLRVATAATAPEIRLAAVDAMSTEDGLKRAERELRGHDRRVHRAAKRRLEAAVAQRETRARAQALIASAHALAALAPVPANRLVALDRDWQALDAGLLDPEQTQAFAELRERLNNAVREQGEQQQRLQRWTAEATRALAALRTACAEAAAHGSGGDIGACREAALAVLDTRPAAPATAELDAALQAALTHATELETRLNEEQAAALAPPPPAEPPPAAPPAALALTAGQRQHLDALLGEAEGAFAQGQLGLMQQHLHAIDAALDAVGGALRDDALRVRHQALLAEHARLKGWQQWGGGRARDELTAEAEALAHATLAAADPDAPKPQRLNLKAHAEAINRLRKRWKELDRLGAPANQALWHRFDAALQTAHQPVAAQQAALKAARDENLASREALLATLDALPEPPASTDPDHAGAHWKELARALDRFHTAWRQLGPVEHTVPAAARGALLQRLSSSLERIEAPLQQARRAAEAVREQLIARAQALVDEQRVHPQMRDAVARLRELQAEWQQHAASLPLARPVEAALWTRFRAAADALFAQRDEAFNARDAEMAANLAAREAVIERLSALTHDAPADHIERTLAEVERAWREPADLPRGAAGALEARYRDARAVASRWLDESRQQRWQAECDSLAAKLAVCEERESAPAGDDDADLTARWTAHGALPAAWERALSQRWSNPAAPPGPLPPPLFDELLLQLEAALDLPATSDQQSARRQLKLRAMKDALEGRASPATGPAQTAEWLTAALRQSGASATQRDRLHAIVAALRASRPGTLSAPLPRG